MRLEPVATDERSIRSYVKLLKSSFTSTDHFTADYLHWLYLQNPVGKVVGFNAYDDETLAGHYACVPTLIDLAGAQVRALLSLSTAVRPDYQGQGLFTRLAEETYKLAQAEGYACVFGVANANSTPEFVDKLGFQLVSPLEAKLGFGALHIDWTLCEKKMLLRRAWNSELIAWRAANPENAINIASAGKASISLLAKTGYPLIRAFSELPPHPSFKANSTSSFPFVRLFIGLFPADVCRYSGYIDIPSRLRTSPLNLIYKNFNTIVDELDPEAIALGFQDFNAY
ncbi:GNAT family N-acetyltransferase [Halieaceae bacterium IMCC14734]|uniref:GNAT family N-acetyltransferase n=1 Tax=Candidatus Litorirhabdus singularis TaxID=2518993 RepID=A0ABT3TMM9_9GAMM|nr:GNAT family N-acetyltransferase [Candidatus Litorirhabdus singularis]MCX2983299.1 GNAT family N-acetyltransferase [Candidatus Litorirhabdus singularis]